MLKENIKIFKNKNFLFYWSSAWFTSLGDSIFIIALTWLLIEEKGSPLVVGTYLFIVGISKMVFILIGGMITDRFNAKHLMIISKIIRALLIFILVGISFADDLNIWLVYCIGAIFGMVDAVEEPATITCRTLIVDKEYYTQSMSLLMIAGNVSAVVGPLVGAGLVALGSTQIAILINAGTFIVSVLLLLKVTFDKQEDIKVNNNNILQDAKDGIKYFISTPIIFTMAVFAFFANAAVGATIVSIPFLATDKGFGVEGFGLMNTGIGVGSAIGALLFSLWIIRNPKPYMTLLTCFLQGIVIVCIGFTDHILFLLLLFALLGLHETAVNVIAPSVNHTIIPRKLFGRVISVMILVMSGSVPISQAIAGWSMEWVKPEVVFIYAGLLEVIAAIIVFCLPFVRHYGKVPNNVKVSRTSI
ncbi:MFS family permease [Bacillus mesophilus]|uniref:MFS transporter n=1 Tax=Bacillus mesophilus TaxID=1808955 RepID=A0A6M0Q486_9BACI|nr:MFS transporter [Bacillus mesophilus]MBM7660311.1 MFS family permease [Bacillus mesophilus]NEY71024.1 MFS transporter [Bacillus mesophilus]